MKEEKKAWALIEQGYDGSYNGDAYGSVMYQNENLSVRVSDAFMQAALDGKEWWTRSVTTGQPLEKVINDTDRDNYLSAQAAVEYGLIDKVLTSRSAL